MKFNLGLVKARNLKYTEHELQEGFDIYMTCTEMSCLPNVFIWDFADIRRHVSTAVSGWILGLPPCNFVKYSTLIIIFWVCLVTEYEASTMCQNDQCFINRSMNVSNIITIRILKAKFHQRYIAEETVLIHQCTAFADNTYKSVRHSDGPERCGKCSRGPEANYRVGWWKLHAI